MCQAEQEGGRRVLDFELIVETLPALVFLQAGYRQPVFGSEIFLRSVSQKRKGWRLPVSLPRRAPGESKVLLDPGVHAED